MDLLKDILVKLKKLGCCGIKVSFEDEGALYNEIITMRNLTTAVDLELSIKIGGCEAKRDINDCMDLNCDTIVAPMVESKFALNKRFCNQKLRSRQRVRKIKKNHWALTQGKILQEYSITIALHLRTQ